jgi:hypothetical protein
VISGVLIADVMRPAIVRADKNTLPVQLINLPVTGQTL